MPRLTRRSLLGGGALLAATASLPRRARAADPLISMVRSHAPACGEALCLPTRPSGALGGEDLAHALADLPDGERYLALADQVLDGNVPAFLRVLSPVTLVAPPGHDGPHLATIFVTPDYLAVGNRQDFLRVPLDLPQAARIARALDMALPTPRMVDAIYAAAQTVLAPAPLPPTSRMRSMPYVLHHQALVEQARAGRSVLPLMAGHKKDVVLTNRLRSQPDRVAIYGWHRGDGDPIQPLSLVHGKGYADYSHGVRLVSRLALVDGVPVDLFDALADPRIAPLFTREGRLPGAQDLLQVA